jgi:hypothetical protein
MLVFMVSLPMKWWQGLWGVISRPMLFNILKNHERFWQFKLEQYKPSKWDMREFFSSIKQERAE